MKTNLTLILSIIITAGWIVKSNADWQETTITSIKSTNTPKGEEYGRTDPNGLKDHWKKDEPIKSTPVVVETYKRPDTSHILMALPKPPEVPKVDPKDAKIKALNEKVVALKKALSEPVKVTARFEEE